MKRNKIRKEQRIESIEEDELLDIPLKSILFGGHPNWQKHFAEKHPDRKLKIIGPKSVNFNTNILTSASCIILNARHMSHSQYYRFMPIIKKSCRRIIYIK